MKKIFLITVLLLPFTWLYSQIKGNLFGESYNFEKPRMSSGGGGGNNNNYSNWSSSNTASSPAPTSSETITEAYQEKARKEYNKGVEAWKKRNWDDAIKFFKKATIFNEKNSSYQKALDEARGYKEWDEGIKEAEQGNWDKAIDKYKKSLEYFPNDTTLKNNIIACSYNKTLGLAQKYFDKEDYVNAAVYYNVLWKNFGNDSRYVQDRYSECYSKIGEMKKAEQGYAKFSSKLEEVKRELPFVNNSWE